MYICVCERGDICQKTVITASLLLASCISAALLCEETLTSSAAHVLGGSRPRRLTSSAAAVSSPLLRAPPASLLDADITLPSRVQSAAIVWIIVWIRFPTALSKCLNCAVSRKRLPIYQKTTNPNSQPESKIRPKLDWVLCLFICLCW